MTQEALKLAEDYAHMRAIWYVESLYGTSASHTELTEKVMLGAHQALKEALAQTQEPVAWLITDEKINSLQVDSIQRLVDRARHAHMTDIKLRINGQDEWHQADWLKHLTRTTPPQRTEQEPVALETLLKWDDDIDPIGEVVGFIEGSPYIMVKVHKGKQVSLDDDLYATPPQRSESSGKPSAWVGLTDEEIQECYSEAYKIVQGRQLEIAFSKAIEAKLKLKNGFAEENT